MINERHAIVMGDLNLVRCFSLSGIPYIPVATTSSALVLYSRGAMKKARIADPLLSEENSKNELIATLGNKSCKPTLFYSNDQQLLMISRHRDELSQYFNFLMPSHKIIHDCVDKESFISQCKLHNLALPYTYSKAEIKTPNIQNKLTYPCIIKPTTRFHWRVNGIDPKEKVIIVNSKEHLLKLLESIEDDKDFVIQQFIPGNDDLIYSYHAFYDENLNSLGHYCGRKIRCNPIVNGYSSAVELIHHEELAAIGDNIIKRLGVYGPSKIDFKLNQQDGKFYILEINPRYNMWHYLGMKSGINLPKIAFDYLNGNKVSCSGTYSTKHKWANFRKDFPSALKYYKNGQLTLLGLVRSYFPYTIFDKVSMYDPLPGIMGFTFYVINRFKSILNIFHRK